MLVTRAVLADASVRPVSGSAGSCASGCRRRRPRSPRPSGRRTPNGLGYRRRSRRRPLSWRRSLASWRSGPVMRRRRSSRRRRCSRATPASSTPPCARSTMACRRSRRSSPAPTIRPPSWPPSTTSTSRPRRPTSGTWVGASPGSSRESSRPDLWHADGRPAVIVADDLDPSAVATLRPELVAGIALAGGAPTGHASIVARGAWDRPRPWSRRRRGRCGRGRTGARRRR